MKIASPNHSKSLLQETKEANKTAYMHKIVRFKRISMILEMLKILKKGGVVLRDQKIKKL